MCYGFKPVRDSEGRWYFVLPLEFRRLEKEGKIKLVDYDTYVFVKDVVDVLSNRNGTLTYTPMRWDLIPPFFQGDSVEDVIKRKNSRKKDPHTGRRIGYDSYNARIESIAEKPTFRNAWKKRMRCVVPTWAFKERPNKDGAPKEFQGIEYNVELDQVYFFGSIYDTWKSKSGETLDSFSVVTMSGEGHPLMDAIWHERIPVLLNGDQVEMWLDPMVAPEDLLELCKPLSADHMQAVISDPKKKS